MVNFYMIPPWWCVLFSSYKGMVCSYWRSMIDKSSACPLKTRDNVICKMSGAGVTNPMMESSTVLPLHNTAHRAAVQWPAPPRGHCTSVLCCYHRHWYLQIPWSPGACNIIIEQGGNGHEVTTSLRTCSVLRALIYLMSSHFCSLLYRNFSINLPKLILVTFTKLILSIINHNLTNQWPPSCLGLCLGRGGGRGNDNWSVL